MMQRYYKSQRIYLDATRFVKANGPAIKGGCVTRREHRAGSRYFSRETITVQGGYGTCFCSPGTNFNEHYERRGTSLKSGRKAVSVTGS
jgi:hypothetical protein